MKILKVGICGWGNVATGMFNAIESNNKFIKQSGVNIDISCIGARRDNPNVIQETFLYLEIFLKYLIKI